MESYGGILAVAGTAHQFSSTYKVTDSALRMLQAELSSILTTMEEATYFRGHLEILMTHGLRSTATATVSLITYRSYSAISLPSQIHRRAKNATAFWRWLSLTSQ